MTLREFLRRVDAFFWAPVSSTGFGLMRIAYGLITFLSFAFQWQDVATYYSDEGLLPRGMIPTFLRMNDRLSIFDFIGDPGVIFFLYLVLLLALVLVTIGWWTRPALIVSTILLFSFHERLWALLAGGDTMLRLIAFLLLLSPCHRSVSFWSAKRRFDAWMRGKPDPSGSLHVMPAWPYRLLLWQLIVVYVSAAWTKSLGPMWWDGSAIGIAMRHAFFSRITESTAEFFDPLLPLGGHIVMGLQFAWTLFLILPLLRHVNRHVRSIIDGIPWRLIIIAGNSFIHLMIAVLMDVGVFSFAMFAAFFGVLDASDIARLKRWMKTITPGTIVVLYDGSCGLCKKSIFMMKICDWFSVLRLEDLHNAAARKKFAPAIPVAELDRVMHVRLPDGTFRTGFAAFRAMALRLPAFWFVAPLLYLPGVRLIGDHVYAFVASRRHCIIARH